MSDLDRADEALHNLSAHRCLTSDGMAIICLCIRGEDHDEDEFDVAIGDTDDA